MYLPQKVGAGIFISVELHRIGQEHVCSFIEFLYSHMPRGDGDDTLTWKLTKKGVFDVHSHYKLLFRPYNKVFPRGVFGVQRCLNGCLSSYGQQLGIGKSLLII